LYYVAEDDLLYVADRPGAKVWIANASDGSVVGTIEGLGDIHWVAVDQMGNVYTANPTAFEAPRRAGVIVRAGRRVWYKMEAPRDRGSRGLRIRPGTPREELPALEPGDEAKERGGEAPASSRLASACRTCGAGSRPGRACAAGSRPA
jgi:hypothetical protein